jgi:hypothetical protein
MNEKQRFTNSRKNNDWIVQNGNIRELEEKWGRYCFLPLDIPPLSEAKKITDWYFNYARPVHKIRSDIATDYTGGLSSFNSINVNLFPEPRENLGIWEEVIDHDFLNEFPKFTEELHSIFPYNKILCYNFWQSIRPISFHRDEQDFRDFPSSFRSIIYDENPDPTLYVKEYLPDAEDPVPSKSIQIPRIDGAPNFVWNNLRTKHGSSYDSKFRKIILIIHASPDIDFKRYDELMERSLSKYSKHALVSDHSINDFIIDPYKPNNVPRCELNRALINPEIFKHLFR